MREACGMPITRSAVQDTYLGVGIPGSEASGATGGGGGCVPQRGRVEARAAPRASWCPALRAWGVTSGVTSELEVP